MEQIAYLHAINLLPQFGTARLGRLWKYFNNWEAAFKAQPADLGRAGIEPPFVDILMAHRQKVNLEYEMQKLETYGIKLLSYHDPRYPKLLLQIHDAPPLLYYKGLMDIPNEFCIAVVGTRKITAYGKTAGPRIIQPVIDRGMTIVSGLAYGVDSYMQALCVKSGRRTIAVLGGGLDDESFYPKEHQLLADQILTAGGALISEHPIGTPSHKFNFLARNRIISGLSLGTIIIESDLKGGSLSTAEFALEQNRSVFALPGSVHNPMSRGTNNLIKAGAVPVTEAKDIFNELQLWIPSEKDKTTGRINGDNLLETKILAQLSLEPKLINDIIKLTNLTAGDVTATLTFLEIKGRVKNLGGQQYVLYFPYKEG